MEKLTIQHISPYLPYGLQVKFNKEKESNAYTITCDELVSGGEMPLSKALKLQSLPILYPISCLTKTIQHEGMEFCPYIELMKLFSKEEAYLQYDINDENIGVTDSKGMNLRYVSQGIFILTKGKKQYGFNSLQIFQKLAEWHINFNGIPKGLYIDKNTLK